jgi:alanine dehydrogenase
MPGAVARSSTIALTSVTLQYGLQIVQSGIEAVGMLGKAIRRGMNTHGGKCVHPGVAKSCNLPYSELPF